MKNIISPAIQSSQFLVLFQLTYTSVLMFSMTLYDMMCSRGAVKNIKHVLHKDT